MAHPVLTRADVELCLHPRRSDILRLGVVRLALFGSVQRNTARFDSDVDFLVEFEAGHKTFDHFVQLGDLLESVLGRRVELVTPESLSPYLRPLILTEARDVLRAA